jgi:hypothetical protein
VTVGTPGFIAPEQLHGLPATPQTDLYGLGCLLYEMLAGEPVFTASSPAGLIRMHLDQAPPPLRRRDVPPQLEWLLQQLLAKNPAHRPADARQAYDLLLPFVEPPGPLGDIDPGASRGAGLLLYAHLLARLSGAGASGPFITGRPVITSTRLAVKAPSPRNDASWTVRHSLWLLPILLLGGLGAWLSFGYIAARHQRLAWLAAAAAYLALSGTAITLTVIGPDPSSGPLPVINDIGVSFLFALWPAAILHGLWVNFRSRLPLLRARQPVRPR